MDKRRLQELGAKALPGAQVLTGMPHPPGVKDKVGDYAAEIADLRGIIEAKYQQCLYERSRLERYIVCYNVTAGVCLTYDFSGCFPLRGGGGGRLKSTRQF